MQKAAGTGKTGSHTFPLSSRQWQMVVSVAEAAAATDFSYAQARLAPATLTDIMDRTDVPIMYKRHMQQC